MDGQVVDIADFKAPDTLYKFRAYTKIHKDTLLNKQIFIPKPKTFNDPQDSNLPFRYNPSELTPENIYKKCVEVVSNRFPTADRTFIENEAYRMQLSKSLQDDQHLNRFDLLQYEQLNRDYGVMCLTPDVGNFLMWSYYSDSHKGFCVGYDTQKLIESNIFGMGGKVLYSKEFPFFPMFPDKNYRSFLNIFYTKSKVWEHEDEYRLIHSFKTGDVQSINIDVIKEIVFGCKFDEKELYKFTEKLLGVFPNAIISKMKLRKDGFGVIKEIQINNDFLIKPTTKIPFV